MGRKKKMSSKDFSESLDCDYEDLEDCGPTEEIDLRNCSVISSFSFGKENASTDVPANKQIVSEAGQRVPMDINKLCFDKSSDSRKPKAQSYGITPPIEGEYFEMKRTFVFRRSTLRMLNKIKAEHPDENIYLSTIIDEALRHYYNHVFK
jgi:hypothetical protein